MNIRSQPTMDGATFLAWVQEREGRFELSGGRVLMMTGGSRGHAIISRKLSNALEQRLDADRWSVLTSDLAVDIGRNTIRYPDVLVDTIDGSLDDLTAKSPVLIAEVLSPSSVTSDLGDKAAEYLRLPSLAAYLVLSQDEPKAWVWVRGEAGFAAGPEVIAGLDGLVLVPFLELELPLAEIYRGIALAQSQD